MSGALVDPALAGVARGALALMLGAAALAKLRDARAFEGAVAGYALLPARVVPVAARTLPGLELAAAAALLAPGLGPAGAALAAALLGLYSAAIAQSLARGRRDIDCGCFGPAARVPLGGGLLARNAVLLGLAALAALPVTPRALGPADVPALAGGAAAVALLHAAASQLLAHTLALGAERSPP